MSDTPAEWAKKLGIDLSVCILCRTRPPCRADGVADFGMNTCRECRERCALERTEAVEKAKRRRAQRTAEGKNVYGNDD